MPKLFSVAWTEYERGWGNRPDGTSFFTTAAEAESIRQNCFARRRENSGVVPDCYDHPDEVREIEVSQDLYDFIHRTGAQWMHMNSDAAALAFTDEKVDK